METIKLSPEYGWYSLSDLPPRTTLDSLTNCQAATIINQFKVKDNETDVDIKHAVMGKLHAERAGDRTEVYILTNDERYSGAVPRHGIPFKKYNYSWTLGDFKINVSNVQFKLSNYEDANFVFVKLHESKLKIPTSILTNIIPDN
jgi:hypothetical protein